MKDRNAFNESQQYFSSDLKLVIALGHGVMRERERAIVIGITFLNFRAVRKRRIIVLTICIKFCPLIG